MSHAQAEGALRAADIVAFYINMPDRPARRAFAEAQYRALGIRAARIEGSALPNKTLGNLMAWQRAVDACAAALGDRAGTETFCLVAEDDALYRPLNSSEAQVLQDNGYPAWGKANTTADAGRFFAGLSAAIGALPGGLQGAWSGLHLCTLGEMISLAEADGHSLVQGNPWPHERFSTHPVYPGAPDVLLLRRSDAALYQGKLRAYVKDVEAKGSETLIDLLQSRMYTAEDSAAKAGAGGALRMFVADNPQLCQHLTDYSNDPGVRSSVGDGASARSPGKFDDSWGSK